MPTFSAEVLLEAWEQGRDATPGERGLLLLGVAHSELSTEALADWTVGRRDAALLNLRKGIFGSRLVALAECPRCDEALEIELPVSAITVQTPAATSAQFALECAGYRVIYRLPTAGDLAALGRNGGKTPARWLLQRCVLQVDGGQEVDGEGQQTVLESDIPQPRSTSPDLPSPLPTGIPETVLEALATAMVQAVASADPQAEVELSLACPECAAQWQVPFDIVSFLWQELDAWATRLLSEVHILASSYGWSERDILALSQWRRRRYLDLIGT